VLHPLLWGRTSLPFPRDSSFYSRRVFHPLLSTSNCFGSVRTLLLKRDVAPSPICRSLPKVILPLALLPKRCFLPLPRYDARTNVPGITASTQEVFSSSSKVEITHVQRNEFASSASTQEVFSSSSKLTSSSWRTFTQALLYSRGGVAPSPTLTSTCNFSGTRTLLLKRCFLPLPRDTYTPDESYEPVASTQEAFSSSFKEG
jgi:hypothetical protein